MSVYKYLTLICLIFASTFAKEKNYIDKLKEYSHKNVVTIKDKANKTKNFIKKYKKATASGAALLAWCAVGYYLSNPVTITRRAWTVDGIERHRDEESFRTVSIFEQALFSSLILPYKFVQWMDCDVTKIKKMKIFSTLNKLCERESIKYV